MVDSNMYKGLKINFQFILSLSIINYNKATNLSYEAPHNSLMCKYKSLNSSILMRIILQFIL
jgi:hypothetical protein